MKGRHARRLGQPTFKQFRVLVAVAGLLVVLAWNIFGATAFKFLGKNKHTKEGREPAVSLSAKDGAVQAGDQAKLDSVKLVTGAFMPLIGFGTAGLGADTKQAVEWALEAGYRLLDSAQARAWYREDAVGAAIKESKIPRSDLFIVSKLHPRHNGYSITKTQFQQSLDDLGTDYLDLFLIHYPYCFAGICGDSEPPGTWKQSWRALEELHQAGKARAIGVSNFNVDDLKDLLAIAKVRPMVVQARSDPFDANTPLQDLCRQEHVQFMGYSTLGTQWTMQGSETNPVLASPIIIRIAQSRKCTPAQVVLKWALMKGQVVIPRSHSRENIAGNLGARACALAEEDVSAIDALDGKLPT